MGGARHDHVRYTDAGKELIGFDTFRTVVSFPGAVA